MSDHRPKTAALIAYTGGLLSSEGQRRIETHLSRCAICQEELAAMEVYDSLLDDVQSSEVPAIDFESMELPLAREAESLSRRMVAQQRRRSTAPRIAVAVAAAAGLLVWAWPDDRPRVASPSPRSGSTPAAPAPAVEPPRGPREAAQLSPVVTLVAGRVTAAGRPLALGDLVEESSEVQTADGEVHIRLRDGTGVRLGAASHVTFSRTREDVVSLELHQGTIAQRVAPLSSWGAGGRASYAVSCAGYEVRVTGTQFEVSRVGSVVGVDLAEGTVLVHTPDDGEILLHAPARWRSSGGVDGAPASRTIRGLVEPRLAPTRVTLSDLRLVRWSVDGLDVRSAGDVQIGLTPGQHEIRAWDARGRLYRALLPVGDAPVVLEPDALRPQAPRLRAGHLDPQDAARVLSRGTRQLQRCYELALRRGSQAPTGRVRLRLSIGVMGDVDRAQVLDLPAGPMSRCIQSYASRWSFPPPGGPVTLEQPVTLAPTQ